MHVHPVLSLNLLNGFIVFVHKMLYILHCLQKTPLFLALDLALVHSSTPLRLCFMEHTPGEAAIIEREKGIEQREAGL